MGGVIINGGITGRVFSFTSLLLHLLISAILRYLHPNLCGISCLEAKGGHNPRLLSQICLFLVDPAEMAVEVWHDHQ